MCQIQMDYAFSIDNISSIQTVNKVILVFRLACKKIIRARLVNVIWAIEMGFG